MGLFGANMADFQLGLALDDKAGGYLETDEEIAETTGAVVCSVLPLRRRRDSCPADEVVGFSNSDATRETRAAQARGHQGRLDHGRRGH